jgi:hypothetical protein
MYNTQNSLVTDHIGHIKSEIQYDDEHIYYNISLFNNTNVNIPCQFSEIRSSAIINNPDEYHLAVARFLVPMQTMPLLLWPVTTPVSNPPLPNNNFYAVSMTYTVGSNAESAPETVFLRYAGSYSFNPSIIVNYPMYSYQEFIDAINIGIATATSRLIAAAAINSVTLSFNRPWLSFNPPNTLLTFNCDVSMLSATAGPPPITVVKLYFNTQLFQYLKAFPVTYYGQTILNNPLLVPELNYQLNIVDLGTNKTAVNAIYSPPSEIYNINPSLPNTPVAATSTYQAYQMSQEFSSLYAWNSLRNIIFTTSSIPIRNEYTPIVPSENLIPSTANQNFQPILTDFIPNISNTDNARSFIQYYPQGPYRWVDLRSTSPLTRIDLQIYWSDKSLTQYLLELQPGECFNVKFLFQRKRVWKIKELKNKDDRDDRGGNMKQRERESSYAKKYGF